ncbi:MAG: adenosylcobinamide-phosphate synthase CbiB [Leptospirales bacterium]
MENWLGNVQEFTGVPFFQGLVLYLAVLFAFLLDCLLGEPARFHPLAGFGKLANSIEKHFYGARVMGVIALFILITPFVGVSVYLYYLFPFATSVIILYFALGGNSLQKHARSIHEALIQKKLPEARRRTGMIVSRDTKNLDETGISKATIESVLENGNDAIFGALFWFLVAGAPGVLCFRLVNTLDAMWGYRNERYLKFGWAAARTDDVMNFIPARLTAFSYAIAGSFRNALRAWKQQGGTWKSPNAGPVMASGAGSLKLSLGGSAIYSSRIEKRQTLGNGPEPVASDIDRSISLLRRALLVWFIFIIPCMLFLREVSLA